MIKFYIQMNNTKANIIRKVKESFTCKRGELGMGTLIAIAVAIIVAAFVMIPGLRSFASSVLSSMNSWWTNTVRDDIFPTT